VTVYRVVAIIIKYKQCARQIQKWYNPLSTILFAARLAENWKTKDIFPFTLLLDFPSRTNFQFDPETVCRSRPNSNRALPAVSATCSTWSWPIRFVRGARCEKTSRMKWPKHINQNKKHKHGSKNTHYQWPQQNVAEFVKEVDWSEQHCNRRCDRGSCCRQNRWSHCYQSMLCTLLSGYNPRQGAVGVAKV